MKNIPVVIAAAMLLTFVGCKGQQKNSQDQAKKTEQKNAGPQPTSDPAVYKGVTNDSCAAEMAFGSPGSGIDGMAHNRVMEIIKERNLSYTAKSIGKEGETRICLPLTELKGAEKESLLEQLKKIAREGQFVSVSIR
jgi:hypothetical protein